MRQQQDAARVALLTQVDRRAADPHHVHADTRPLGVGNRRANLADQRLDLSGRERHQHQRIVDLDPALLGQRLADHDLLGRARDPCPGRPRSSCVRCRGTSPRRRAHPPQGRSRPRTGPRAPRPARPPHARQASGRPRPPTVQAGGRRPARRMRGSTSQTGRRNSPCGERPRSRASTTAPATPTTRASTTT